MNIRLLLAVVAFFALSSSHAWAQDGGRLTVDRYLDWEDVTSPQLSPDGRQVVYERRWVDGVHDRWESAIWIMNADGSKNRHLADGSSPRWSPDGSRIAFVAPGDPRGAQIFVRWMDAEGAVSQVTRLNESPSGLAWSPEGDRIAFQMLVPGELDSDWRITMPPAPDGAEWTASPRIIDRLHYQQDRVGFVPRGFEHVFVVAAVGGTPHQVTSGDWDHGTPQWTADGGTIVFSSLRTEDAEWAWRESEIYAADVQTGAIRQLTRRAGPDQNPVPSPDGRFIAYTGYDASTDTYVEAGLYVMNADGSNPRRIADEKGRSPTGIRWDSNSAGVYFTGEMRGGRNLWYAPISGDARAVTTGDHMLSVSDMTGDLAVGTWSDSYSSNAVVAFTLSAPGEITPLHHTNQTQLSEVSLGEVEEIWYPSVGGMDIHGWIVKPPDFDPSRKYPLILRIHGGPHSMYNSAFDFKNQNHAANGYVVLYTNPRGSSGYGSAFGNAIKNAYPSQDYDDLMAGVDTMLGRGYIDDRNLFVYGGSGGGVLTAWIVGHTDRFTAAVAKAPVINWISFVGTTDGAGWYRNFAELPWNDPSEHLQRSPLMYVGNVTTPTLVMTGQRDRRTPMPESEQFYRALKLRKIPTGLIQLTDGWHSRNLPPTNFIRVQLHVRSWFERFMVGGARAVESGGN
jgi:dipeptidyl aminopeptidase/acylaminoacyl peptidase